MTDARVLDKVDAQLGVPSTPAPNVPIHHTEQEEQAQKEGENKHVVVIGAGPAGLTAACELVKRGLKPTVLERGDKVGGLARTENYKGFHFDMGGHRFFTKSAEVEAFWRELLAEELLTRSRLSRIFYRNKFFYYPLKPINALLGLGFIESVLIILSYLRWKVFPFRQEETFEQWVTNRFGRRLFQTFFKTYTKKVGGGFPARNSRPNGRPSGSRICR